MFLSDYQNGYNSTLIVAASLAPAFLCVLAIIYKKDKDKFSPLYMLLYMTFLGSFLKAFYLLYLDANGDAKRVTLANLDLPILLPGALVLTIGVFFAILGYFVPKLPLPSPTQTSGHFEFSISMTRWLGLFAMLVGSVMFFVFFQILDLGPEIAKGIISAKRVHEETVGNAPRGAAFGYLRMGAQTLPQIALFMHATNMMVRKTNIYWLDIVLLIALGFLSLLLPFLTSSRLEMFYVAIILLIVFHYCVSRITFSKGIAVAAILLLTLTMLGQLRILSSPSYKGTGSIQLGISSILESTIARGYFMGIDKTSVIVDAVPDRVDYLYGKSLMLFVYGPIPRSIWPEKPAIRIGPFVGKQIYKKENKSGVPPGFVGELYLNFGYSAVILGMFIYGVLYSFFYKRTVLTSTSPLSKLLYSIGTLILSFSLLSGDLAVAMSQIFRYGVCLIFCLVLLRFAIPKVFPSTISLREN